MKTIAILMMCAAMAACAVEPVATTADEQAIVCDPNCDPANVQYLLAAYITAGQAYGSERGPAWCRVQHGYNDFGDPISYNVCSGVWGDDGGHNTQVFCNDQNGNQCATWGCGEGSEPPCHS